MNIWNKGPRTVLGLLLSSTAHKFYISELAACTGLARNTVCSILDRLESAELVVRKKERFEYDHPARAARVYYTLDPHNIHHLRLHAPST